MMQDTKASGAALVVLTLEEAEQVSGGQGKDNQPPPAPPTREGGPGVVPGDYGGEF